MPSFRPHSFHSSRMLPLHTFRCVLITLIISLVTLLFLYLSVSISPRLLFSSSSSFFSRRSSEESTSQPQPSLTILTYATHQCSRFCHFLHSCAQNHLNVSIVGWEPNPEKRRSKMAHGHKLSGFADFLRPYLSTQPHDNPTILFVDSYDSIFVSSADTILQKYQALHAPVVCEAETGCYPHRQFASGPSLCQALTPPSPTMYRYLNLGGCIGNAKAIYHFLHDITSSTQSFSRSDQGMVANLMMCDRLNALYANHSVESVTRFEADYILHWLNNNPSTTKLCQLTGQTRYDIHLDTNCDIFQSTAVSYVNQSEILRNIYLDFRLSYHLAFDEHEQAWQNIHTRTFPSNLHANQLRKNIDHLFEHGVFSARRPPRVPLSDYDQYIHFIGFPNVKFADVCSTNVSAFLATFEPPKADLVNSLNEMYSSDSKDCRA
eukprot:TRINITY_DN3199_c0_g1_i1.p1 TRINITY_DN3199_c0_g1~~TRINITY_DN3199_c0_g1_i1.p1  ORF type:complete len:434 (+),score=80.75 TRINITY_DN3199_c0_g1_i1:66-1367(+)